MVEIGEIQQHQAGPTFIETNGWNYLMQKSADMAFTRIVKVLEKYPAREIEIGGVGLSLTTNDSFKEQQTGYRFTPGGQALIGDEKGDWKAEWWVIGTDRLVFDPILVDIDTEDLIVYTAEHGQGSWQVELISNSLKGLLESIEVLYQFKQAYINYKTNKQIPVREILTTTQNQVKQNCEVQAGYWKNYFGSLLDIIENFDDGLID